jgi:hypothetical protein
MSSNREVFFSKAQTTYPPGSHSLPPAVVGAGHQSLAIHRRLQCHAAARRDTL